MDIDQDQLQLPEESPPSRPPSSGLWLFGTMPLFRREGDHASAVRLYRQVAMRRLSLGFPLAAVMDPAGRSHPGLGA
jgi:hypothetical protein